MAKKERLDMLLVRRGLAESRSMAQRLIMGGQVRVRGQMEIKASRLFDPESDIALDEGPTYVSRGGTKLAAALQAFPVTVTERVCADVGASTGGFTDCLLQHGARSVYAIDVGRGQLHWRLRQDERVIVKERTNARYLEALPEQVGLVTVDASFISLKLLVPIMAGWLDDNGDMICLVKPQFEAGRDSVGKGGVVRDVAKRRQAVLGVMDWLLEARIQPCGLIASPIQGPKGNQEYLLWGACRGSGEGIDRLIGRVFPDARN